jgi:hypothetical protein
VLRPLPYLLLCKSLQLSNRRVNASGNASPLAQPARLAPIAADPRGKKNLTAAFCSTIRSHFLHEPQLWQMSSSSYSSFCQLAAQNSLTLVSIGASRAEPFTPSKPVLIPNRLVILYRYLSPPSHVLLRTTSMAGSCASSVMGAATTTVQIWYDNRLLGPKHILTTGCRSKLYIAAR